MQLIGSMCMEKRPCVKFEGFRPGDSWLLDVCQFFSAVHRFLGDLV